MTLTGSVTEVVEAPAREMFALVTDLDRLPAWNELIKQVVERPRPSPCQFNPQEREQPKCEPTCQNTGR